MATFFNFNRLALTCAATAAAFFQPPIHAAEAATTAETIVVTGRAIPPTAGIGGFGPTPLAQTPLQASVISRAQLDDAGVSRLSDITSLDASIADAYNAPGYWSSFSVRGYGVDNRFNFRRDGLPVNGETVIPIDNLDRVEILKGISGMQAGTSAPGGLVNLIVKRPLSNGQANASRATLGWTERGSVLVAADLNRRFGDDERFGIRLNAAYEHIDPKIQAAQGQRRLVALAGEWRASADTLIEADVETSHQSAPSVPAFSLLGNTLPDAKSIDPTINLNNQPWSLPVVFDGTTATLRWQQQLGPDWRFTAHAGIQRLRTDDRLAYPYGCWQEDAYDRYCSDGSFNYYAFQSDNERRRTDALDLSLQGRVQTGPLQHQLTLGVLGSRFEARLQPRVDDGVWVGNGTIDGLTVIPTLPALELVPNTNRTERNTEFYLRDQIALGPDGRLWVGARHTRLQRESVRTDGSRPTRYNQSVTTSWLAVSYAFAPDQMAYASWGQGIESSVTPNKSGYVNPGQPLPAQKSRQIEVGLKGDIDNLSWTLAAFDIDRPTVTDDGENFVIDGTQRHRGLEASLAWRSGPFELNASAMALRASREGAQDVSQNGLNPTNVPERTAKLQAGYDLAALPGLTVLGAMVFESGRYLLPDNSVRIPSWTSLNLGVRYTLRAAAASATTTTLRASIDNLADHRAWRESPYQYGHAYLYPLAPRTVSLSAQVAF